MRILVLGAYGFIGSEITRALLQRGHGVIGLGRDRNFGRRLLPEVLWIEGDLNNLVHSDDWLPILDEIDCVINASGLLQNGEGGSVRRVQQDSISALIQACERVGVIRFVQISATGASSVARNEFMASKGRADDLLHLSTLDHVILRPGLVIGRNCFGGTELIRMIAAMPFVELEPAFDAPLQVIAMSDLVDAALAALSRPAGTRMVTDLVEEQSRKLGSIIAAHRRWLGLAQPRRRLVVPRVAIAVASRIADLLGHFGWRSALRGNALAALRDGVTGDSAATSAFLGRAPLSLEQTLARYPSGKQDRLLARLVLLLPLILVSLTAMWGLSGIGTLLQLDKAEQLLIDAGVGRPSAQRIAIAGALADISVALALLWRRAARPALASMVIITLAYLAFGTFLMPQLWIDPLAPFAKTLPSALLALVGFLMLEER